jgi:hypothetical protein
MVTYLSMYPQDKQLLAYVAHEAFLCCACLLLVLFVFDTRHLLVPSSATQ